MLPAALMIWYINSSSAPRPFYLYDCTHIQQVACGCSDDINNYRDYGNSHEPTSTCPVFRLSAALSLIELLRLVGTVAKARVYATLGFDTLRGRANVLGGFLWVDFLVIDGFTGVSLEQLNALVFEQTIQRSYPVLEADPGKPARQGLLTDTLHARQGRRGGLRAVLVMRLLRCASARGAAARCVPPHAS